MARSISLLYHDVCEPEGPASGFDGPDADAYKLSTAQFAAHLDAIARRIPPGDCLLTFDDGGSSAMRIGEQLSARGWRGWFFVATDYIGRPGFLDADQIRTLAHAGHVIGSHSCSHPLRMSALSQNTLLDEWRRSREVLEALLGNPVRAASIPGGYYSRKVAEAAAIAGFAALFTSEPVARSWRVGALHVFGRFSIQRATPPESAAALAAGDRLPRLQQYMWWALKKGLKRAGGPYWLDLRDTYFRAKAAALQKR